MAKHAYRRPRGTRWCTVHQTHYPAWADKTKTRLGTCHECDDELQRMIAAAERRAAEEASHE